MAFSSGGFGTTIYCDLSLPEGAGVGAGTPGNPYGIDSAVTAVTGGSGSYLVLIRGSNGTPYTSSKYFSRAGTQSAPIALVGCDSSWNAVENMTALPTMDFSGVGASTVGLRTANYHYVHGLKAINATSFGIQLNLLCVGTLLEAADNDSVGIYVASQTHVILCKAHGNGSYGIQGSSSRDHIIACECYDNTTTQIVGGATDSVTMLNWVDAGTGSGIGQSSYLTTIAFNTVWTDNDSTGTGISNPTNDMSILIANIVQGFDGTGGDAFASDAGVHLLNNIYQNTNTYAGTGAEKLVIGQTTLDPQLANPSNNDYTTGNTSLIDIDLPSSVQGLNVGAYQGGSTSAPASGGRGGIFGPMGGGILNFSQVGG